MTLPGGGCPGGFTMSAGKHLALTESDLGRLHDAALDVILTHGVRDDSIGVEVDLWHALQQAIRRENRLMRWLHLGRPNHSSGQDQLGALVRAAFEVARQHAVLEPGGELELDLLFALNGVINRAAQYHAMIA
jgi:hypothetical protein